MYRRTSIPDRNRRQKRPSTSFHSGRLRGGRDTGKRQLERSGHGSESPGQRHRVHSDLQHRRRQHLQRVPDRKHDRKNQSQQSAGLRKHHQRKCLSHLLHNRLRRTTAFVQSLYNIFM